MSEISTATLAIEINALNDELEFSMGYMLSKAALIGQKLNQAKQQLPHGEFGDWLKVNCRVTQRQAQKYMKLAIDMPELLNSNTKFTSHLKIEAAYALLSAPDEVKQEVQAKLDNGESVTQKEIQELKRQNKAEIDARINAEAMARELTKKAEAATTSSENWRQQFFDERNGKRDLQTELFEVKASKKETIYIDNSTKALEQYKEETEQKLFKLKQELKATQEAQHAEVNKRVEQRLKNHTDVVEKMQKQETSLASSIEFLIQKEHELSQKIGLKADHLEARRQCKNGLEVAAIAANILFEEDAKPDEEDKALWLALIERMTVMAATFDGLLKD